MIIKKKLDVKHLLVHFCDIAEWDGKNEKYYLTVEDPVIEGTITFMQYIDGSCTYYRRNESFCDISEIPLENDTVWNYRRLLNREIRKRMGRK